MIQIVLHSTSCSSGYDVRSAVSYSQVLKMSQHFSFQPRPLHTSSANYAGTSKRISQNHETVNCKAQNVKV